MTQDRNFDGDKSNWSLVLRLYREHVLPYRKRLFLAIFCMIATAIATAISAWLMQPVLDNIFLNKEMLMLYVIPGVIILNAMVKGVAHFYEAAVMKQLGQKIINDIQIRLYSHLLYSDTEFLMDYSSGNLISRMTNDINAMKRSVSDVLTGTARELVTLVGLVGLMFYQSYILASIAVFILPLAFYPMVKLGQSMRRVSKNIQEELSAFTERLDETFKHVTLIKSYCREIYEISKAKKIVGNFLKLYKKSAYIESASSPMIEVVTSISIALIIWYGGFEVIESRMTPGAFFSFLVALMMAYRPLKVISSLNTSLQEGLAASRRLFIILDQKPSIVDDISLPKCNLTNFDIKFVDVSFSYKAHTEILNELNLEILQGQTVALVGSSGVGKTTILQLLQRLYDASKGLITIGNQDITKMNPSELRSYIALVSQDIALFDETVLENIRYGRLDATPEEVVRAATAAAAHEFIVSLPHGYHTQIGQYGQKLSGGQRQRLAIARAMLKNSPILLLDEATSALDAVAEKQIQEALDRLKEGRTTIAIAHRLSFIENADLICVLAEGRVVELGKHQELILKRGEYSKFYNQVKAADQQALS